MASGGIIDVIKLLKTGSVFKIARPLPSGAVALSKSQL